MYAIENLSGAGDNSMSDKPIDLGKDAVAGQAQTVEHHANAGNALRDQVLTPPKSGTGDGKATGATGSDKSGTGDSTPVKPDGSTLSANDQRRAQEQAEFSDRFDKQNFDLGHLQKGWGPYQALQEQVRQHKIDLTDEQILQEARRIRDRDFAANKRDYYTSDDKSKFWTQDEVDHHVQAAVDKPKGIDVYSGDGNVDWAKVKDAGYQFAFLKASEGITISDTQLAANRKGALDEGLRIGYYHYFRPNDSVAAQVNNFVKSVGKPDSGAMRLVVDLEDPKIWKPYTVPQRVKMIEDWISGVQKAIGVTPQVMLYSGPDFVNSTLKNPASLGKYDLWLADYNKGAPPIPKPWTDWKFFQYSEHGKVPGISKDTDLDMFSGDNIDEVFAPPKAKANKGK